MDVFHTYLAELDGGRQLHLGARYPLVGWVSTRGVLDAEIKLWLSNLYFSQYADYDIQLLLILPLRVYFWSQPWEEMSVRLHDSVTSSLRKKPQAPSRHEASLTTQPVLMNRKIEKYVPLPRVLLVTILCYYNRRSLYLLCATSWRRLSNGDFLHSLLTPVPDGG